MKQIEEIIRNTTEEEQEKVDWTKAWSTKYPVLATYQKEVDIPKYATEIRRMLTELQEDYNYSEQSKSQTNSHPFRNIMECHCKYQ